MSGRYGAPPHQREDVVQEVWITAFRRWASLRPDASVRAWLASITRRVVARCHRSNARTTRRIRALAASMPAVVLRQDDRGDLDVIGHALERLDADQRAVFLLSQVDGLRAAEIASMLEVPVNTVYSRLRLARSRLAAALEVAANDDHAVASWVREQEAPSSDARLRVRAVVFASLGRPLLVTSSLLTGFGKFALGGVTIAVLGMQVAQTSPAPVRSEIADAQQVGVETEDASPRSGSARARARARASEGSEISTSDEPAAIIEEMPVVAEPVACPEPATTTVAPPQERRTPARRASTFAPAAEAVTPAAEAVSDDAEPPAELPAESVTTSDRDLLTEAALVDAARSALRRGATAEALDHLREHARVFPRGRLALERRATEARVHCASGNTARARDIVDDLVQQAPDSPAATSVRDVCRSPS